MHQSLLVRTFAILAALAAAIITYGSLYPFAFHQPQSGVGAIQTILESWNRRPGRGDFLSNILLYMPLGFCVMSAIPGRISSWARALVALLIGIALSVSIETLQYFDRGRDTQATDIYSNTIGTAIGIALTFILSIPAARGFFGQRLSHRIPLMLLGAWGGYKLYPFVPVIDLHKYWNAIKPLIYHPSTSWYEIFSHTASWMAVGLLVNRITEGKRDGLWYLALAGFLLFSKIFIIDTAPGLADIAGVLLAFLLLLALRNNDRVRVAAVTIALGISVLASRLEPFYFQNFAGEFGWIPFSGFMHGSINVNVLSFLEKFFLYGSLIWLLQEWGYRLLSATVTVAIGLLVTSILELYLPGRSAEITDAMMAGLIGLSFALVGKGERTQVAAPVRRWVR